MEKTQENTDKLMSYIVKEEYSIQEREDQIIQDQNLENRENEIIIEISFRCFVCGIGYGDAQSLFLHLASHGNPGNENSNHTPIITCEEDSGCQVKETLDSRDCQLLSESQKNKTKVSVPRNNHFDCEICGEKIRFEKTLRRHLWRVHDMRNIYKCNQCPLIFKTSTGLQKHKDTMHLGESLPYQNCDKTLSRSIILKEYEKARLGNQGTFECEVCGIKVKYKNSLTRHMKDIHSGSSRTYSFKCKECPKAFKSKSSLVRHSGMHPINPDVEKFNCETCEAKFQHQIGLIDHIKEHHSKDQLKASQSLKTYSRSSKSVVPEKDQETQSPQPDCSLPSQMSEKEDPPEKASQVPVPPFVCKTCGAKFNSSTGFKWHLETHARKLFACIICNKTFQEYNNLAAHEKTHFFGDECELPMNGESAPMQELNDHARKSPETSRRSSTPETVPITLSDSSNSSEVDEKISIDILHIEDEVRDEPSHVSDLEEQKDTQPDELDTRNSKSPFELMRPKKSDSAHKAIECEKCGWKVKTKQGVKRHLLLVHYGKKRHIQLLSQLEPYICPHCDRVFWERSVFECHRSKHANSEHPNGILASEVRKKTLRSSLLLEKRKRTRVAGQMHSDKLYTCQICKKSFRGSFHLKEHEKNHLEVHGVNREKCEICGAELKHKKSLNRHLREVHGKRNSFKCKNCPKTFKTSSDLEKHEETHSVTCQICKKIFKLPEYLKKHEKVHESTCEICGTKLKHKKSLNRHIRNVHGKTINTPVLPLPANAFQCKICPKTFERSLDLEKHNESHPRKLYACQICGKTFEQYKDLRRHRRGHVSKLVKHKIECEICGVKLKYRYNMSRHLKEVHATKNNYKCNQCPLTFKCRSDLQKHKDNKHSGKLFPCQKCGKSFKLPEYLKKHEKVHESTCEICGTKLKLKKSLNRHIRNVHGKTDMLRVAANPFQCKICPKTFATSVDLEKHKDSHPQKLYACQICGKTFSQYKYLRQHRRSHIARVARHKTECQICGKIIKYEYNMRRHLKVVHSRTYISKCTQCPMKFRSVLQLQRHRDLKHSIKCEETTPSIKKEDERIPVDDQGFECEICGAVMKYEKGLTRHIRDIHGKDAKTSRFKCKKCPMIFKSYSDLEKHKDTHQNKNSQIKKTVKRLKERKKTDSALKAIECEKCGWKVKTKRGVMRHLLLVHYGKRRHIQLLSQLEPYICPHCDRVFWEKSVFKSHLYYRHRNLNKTDNKAKSSQSVIEISDVVD